LQEKSKDIFVTALADFLASVFAWVVFYWVRTASGLFGMVSVAVPATVVLPAILISVYWVGLFAFFGLYRALYLQGRFDEVTKVFKISLLGILVLFFVLFMDELGWNASNLGSAKVKTLLYWMIQFVMVALFRIIVRTRQKWRVMRGIGLHRALLVGTGNSAKSVFESLRRNPIMGMRVVGLVQETPEAQPDWNPDVPVLGTLHELRNIVEVHQIDEVIAAFETSDREKIVHVLDQSDLPDVKVKILPDFYQLITGMNRTNQIFGLPFIDVMPDPMPDWEKAAKRMFDFAVALLILLAGLPVWFLVGLLVRLTSAGPAIFRQERVGLYGKPFMMMKFRTMYNDAEKRTGPVWAQDNDPRITPVGWWLRKLRLDEIPQLVNVLRGDMSLVGPRPERQFFVDQFKKEIPLYTRRLRVKPGITGWAQVKWKYDASLEDVKEKTKYDLFYLENMSLRMDFKILLNTLLTVVTAKGK
jgi:exopolysaccharide biosynthesis polyprenyl glycosylphosphotransferase